MSSTDHEIHWPPCPRCHSEDDVRPVLGRKPWHCLVCDAFFDPKDEAWLDALNARIKREAANKQPQPDHATMTAENTPFVEITSNSLRFHFPAVHPDAVLDIDLQRTLRIPDDGKEYPLPAGLGRFPIVDVDAHKERVPDTWLKHGGVMTCLYQSEAMWLNFRSPTGYPFAVKIAAGKVNAVTGAEWSEDLGREPQDYVVVPGQRWLDGFVVAEGTIRQFVAMPLGAGYTVEEQVTHRAEFGGIQLKVFPIKPEHYVPRYPRRAQRKGGPFEPSYGKFYGDSMGEELHENALPCYDFGASASLTPASFASPLRAAAAPKPTVQDMGLASGGRMKQEVFKDTYPADAWDTTQHVRCFIHLLNSFNWRTLTGKEPPTMPFTAADYAYSHYPWFEYYAENETALPAQEALKKIKSVAEIAQEKGEKPLPENDSMAVEKTVPIHAPARPRRPGEVRDGTF